ncbi:MAG: hypothetical protein LBS41_00520 [Streptococcaceae bacterium]|nr:hypothetical protein [Streptococcaceae bacterium]
MVEHQTLEEQIAQLENQIEDQLKHEKAQREFEADDETEIQNGFYHRLVTRLKANRLLVLIGGAFISVLLIIMLVFSHVNNRIAGTWSGGMGSGEDKLEYALTVKGSRALLEVYVYGIKGGYSGIVNRTKRVIAFGGDQGTVKYQLINGKLLLKLKNHAAGVILKKKQATKATAKITQKIGSTPISTSESKKKLSLEEVKEQAEKVVGVSVALADDSLDDLEQSVEGAYFYITYKTADNQDISSYGEESKTHKVTKVLSVTDNGDDEFDLTFIVE